MRIAPLRERIIFQERRRKIDEVGNESSDWEELFSRWCSCRPLVLSEGDGVVTKLSYHKVQITLRYDPSVLTLDSRKIRACFRHHLYQIESIDGDSVPRQLIYMTAAQEEEYDQD